MVDLLLLLTVAVVLLAFALGRRVSEARAARRRETLAAALGLVVRFRSNILRAGQEIARTRRHADISLARMVAWTEMEHDPHSPLVVVHRPHRPPVAGAGRTVPATGSMPGATSVVGGANPTSGAHHSSAHVGVAMTSWPATPECPRG